jgi:hypothetical protein
MVLSWDSHNQLASKEQNEIEYGSGVLPLGLGLIPAWSTPLPCGSGYKPGSFLNIIGGKRLCTGFSGWDSAF